MSGRKASLVVVVRRFVRPVAVDEPWALEEGLVKLGKNVVGYGLAVLATIPGSILEPRTIPMGLLVSPDGQRVDEGGIPLRTACSCAVRVHDGDQLHETVSEAVNRWVDRNRDRWWLEDGSNGDAWREVAFLRGYHAITHVERRLELARRRDRQALEVKLTHEREVETFARASGL